MVLWKGMLFLNGLIHGGVGGDSGLLGALGARGSGEKIWSPFPNSSLT